MTQEALKLALAAFYQIFESTPPYRDDGTCVINDKSVELSNKAIAAIKEALAQEPVALPCCGYADASAIKWNPYNQVVHCHNCGQIYTIPPQRTWVGLEGKEIRNLWEEATKPDRSTMTMVTSFARAIDAKLKEKNGMTQEVEQSIYYMRDNHTFKKLSEDIRAALIEIEHEFNEGYTYGSLCSKRDGFRMVNASGSKNRLAFFTECKSVLEKWLPKAAPPQPEQEPVACPNIGSLGMPVNVTVTPPQRTWEGLTDEDRLRLWLKTESEDVDRYAFAKAIEAKLKEKNT